MKYDEDDLFTLWALSCGAKQITRFLTVGADLAIEIANAATFHFYLQECLDDAKFQTHDFYGDRVLIKWHTDESCGRQRIYRQDINLKGDK